MLSITITDELLQPLVLLLYMPFGCDQLVDMDYLRDWGWGALKVRRGQKRGEAVTQDQRIIQSI